MSGTLPYNISNPYLCSYQYPVGCMCKMELDGQGSVMATPDTAEVVLGVTTENLQLEIAQQENAVKTAEVIKAVLNTGVPSEAIQTQTYNIEPMYDYIDGKQVFRGYRVTHTLRVTIGNVNMVGRVIDAAVNAGANIVNSISFSVSNPSVYYGKALNSAINDTMTKAASIGNRLNVQISRVPIQIIEKTYQEVPVQPFQMQTTAAATPVQPGQIEITARIKAVFMYSC